MALDELDNLDLDIQRDLDRRAAEQDEREQKQRDRDAERRKMRAAMEASSSSEASAPDEVDDPQQDQAPSEDGTSILGDLATGFVGGLRDAGVNIAQTVVDVGTFGQAEVDLDSMFPDVEDRDSATFGLTKGITQFATGFIPALGVLGWLSKGAKVSKGLAAVRSSGKVGQLLTRTGKGGEALLGHAASGMVAGAAADATVFDPLEARFSDFVEDTRFANPVTDFLASDEDDSAAEGRFKNVIEGMGLGLVAEGLFAGVRGMRSVHKARREAGRANEALADEAHGVHVEVINGRQRYDEGVTVADEWDHQLKPREVPGLDEHGAPLDAAVRDDAPLEQLRAVDPALAARVENGAITARDAILEHKRNVAHEMSLIEDNLIDYRNSENYANLPAKLRKKFEAGIEEGTTPKARKLVEERAAEAGPERATAHEKLPQTDPEPPPVRPEEVVRPDTEIPTVNYRRLRDHHEIEEETGRAYRDRKIIPTQDPVVAEAILTAVARGAKIQHAPWALDVQALGQVTGANNTNVARIAAPGGLQQFYDELSTVTRVHSKANKGHVTHAKTAERAEKAVQALAKSLGDESAWDEYMAGMTELYDDLAEIETRATAYRTADISLASQAADLFARVTRVGGGSREDLAQAALAMSNLAHHNSLLAGIKESSGRLLSSMGADVKVSSVLTEALDSAQRGVDIDDIIARAGGEEAILAAAKQLSPVVNHTAKRNNMLQQMGRKGVLRKMFTEAWLNGLLSGPQTQVVNNFSNALVTIWSPAEVWIQGALTGNSHMRAMAMQKYKALFESFRAAIHLSEAGHVAMREIKTARRAGASKEQVKMMLADKGDDIGPVIRAWMTDEPQTVKGARQFENMGGNEIGHENTNFLFSSSIEGPLKEGSTGAKMVDSFGSIVNWPSRLLTAGDELAKSVNYHMELNSLAYDDAVRMLNEGKITSEGFDAYQKQIVDEVPRWGSDPNLDPDLRARYQQLHELSGSYAKRQTWTDPLAPGTMGKSMQDFVTKHPTMKFVVPFIRTPMNLMYFVGRRTPGIANMGREYKAAFAAAKGEIPDTAALHAARTRVGIGTAFYTLAGVAAMNGNLTGAGPGEPNERKALFATGWQPNSFRIEQDDGSFKYVSFNRADPFGMFLGIAATIGETIGMLGEAEGAELATTAVIALAETLKSKSYFVGLTGLINALEQPDRRMETLLERYAGSLVPNVVGSFNRTNVDPNMREVDGLLDAIRAKIPGLSDNLPPRRNMFGEVISYAMGVGPDTVSPFQSRTSPNSRVNKELYRLSRAHGFSFSDSWSKSLRGIELSPQERDRLVILATTDTSRNGADLRAGLEKLMKTSKYKRADDSDDGKQRLIRDFISKRRSRGKRVFLREHPELAQQIRENRRQAREAARNNESKQASTGGSVVDQFTSTLGSTPRNLT